MDILEIKLKKEELIVHETCSRIGIPNKRKKILYPSCYVIKEDDRYFLVHFKQMFLLERKSAYDNICEDDILRRNAIAYCLKQWGLIDVDDELITPHDKFVFVLPHKEKKNWNIQHKYNVKAFLENKQEN